MKTIPETAYEYKAEVVRWIDGDTVELDVDLGFRLRFKDHFRLEGIDTPERGKAGSVDAWVRAKELAPMGSDVLVQTSKSDKYGRYLAAIWPDVGPPINITLVNEGHAVPYYGDKK